MASNANKLPYIGYKNTADARKQARAGEAGGQEGGERSAKDKYTRRVGSERARASLSLTYALGYAGSG